MTRRSIDEVAMRFVTSVHELMVKRGWMDHEIIGQDAQTAVYRRDFHSGLMLIAYVIIERDGQQRKKTALAKGNPSASLTVEAWSGINYPPADGLVEKLLRQRWRGCNLVRQAKYVSGDIMSIHDVDIVTTSKRLVDCIEDDVQELVDGGITLGGMIEQLMGPDKTGVVKGVPSKPAPMVFWSGMDPAISLVALLVCAGRTEDAHAALRELEAVDIPGPTASQRRAFARECVAWLKGTWTMSQQVRPRWDVGKSGQGKPVRRNWGKVRRKTLALVGKVGDCTREQLAALLAQEYRHNGIPVDPVSMEFEMDLIERTRKRRGGETLRAIYTIKRLIQAAGVKERALVDILRDGYAETSDEQKLPLNARYHVVRVTHDFVAVNINTAAVSWLKDTFHAAVMAPGTVQITRTWFRNDQEPGHLISAYIGAKRVGVLDGPTSFLYGQVVESAKETDELPWVDARLVWAPGSRQIFILAVPVPEMGA